MIRSVIVCICFNFLCGVCFRFPINLATRRIAQRKTHIKVVSNDAIVIRDFFNGAGFYRWNRIYSDTANVSKIQLDIRHGHAKTIKTVLKWINGEDNQQKSICDVGCGVGTLCIPLASKFSQVTASDISLAMVNEAKKRSQEANILNISFYISDFGANLSLHDTVACIDVMIHYPTNKVIKIIKELTAITRTRLIVSFAPYTPFFAALKGIGSLFPGQSKATRAYLHKEKAVVSALSSLGFKINRKTFIHSKFYYSIVLEAVRI